MARLPQGHTSEFLSNGPISCAACPRTRQARSQEAQANWEAALGSKERALQHLEAALARQRPTPAPALAAPAAAHDAARDHAHDHAALTAGAAGPARGAPAAAGSEAGHAAAELALASAHGGQLDAEVARLRAELAEARGQAAAAAAAEADRQRAAAAAAEADRQRAAAATAEADRQRAAAAAADAGRRQALAGAATGDGHHAATAAAGRQREAEAGGRQAAAAPAAAEAPDQGGAAAALVEHERAARHADAAPSVAQCRRLQAANQVSARLALPAPARLMRKKDNAVPYSGTLLRAGALSGRASTVRLAAVIAMQLPQSRMCSAHTRQAAQPVWQQPSGSPPPRLYARQALQQELVAARAALAEASAAAAPAPDQAAWPTAAAPGAPRAPAPAQPVSAPPAAPAPACRDGLHACACGAAGRAAADAGALQQRLAAVHRRLLARDASAHKYKVLGAAWWGYAE